MVLGKNFICSKRSDGERLSILLDNRTKTDTVMFEGGVVAELSTAEADALRRQYTKVTDAYACLGVMNLYIDDECYSYLMLVTGCTSIGKICESDIFRISGCTGVALQEPSELDSKVNEVQKLIMSGCFYFSWTAGENPPYDLSLSSQRKHLQKESDNRFFWNRSFHLLLSKFGLNCDKWLVRMTCGSIDIRTIYVGSNQAKACLISRLSSDRAGTRFNVRGTNDEGHVANFVETEQLVINDETVTSFVQTRGSVPLFWEQPGVQVGSHKVKVSRGFEASQPAFDRHISHLKQVYGYQLFINLLGRKEGENSLSMAFKEHLKSSQHSFDTRIINFDYHSHCRGGKTAKLDELMEKAKPSLENFKFFSYYNGNVTSSQGGTIRTNCLDCLDRTNAVQSKLGMKLLREQLKSIELTDKPGIVDRFQETFKNLWIQNGHQVSRMYSGTGALDSSVKGTVASKLHDGAVSVKRTIKNNFFDGSRQEAIDILLVGNTFIGPIGERARALLHSGFLHSSPSILRELCLKHHEYSEMTEARVCVGTWNVNGGRHFRSIAYKHQSMHDWLLDCPKLAPEGIMDKEADFSTPPDIFAIGFQELVDLNISNIISTSSTQKKQWGSELQRIISRDNPYVLITVEQLVGVCLYIFVRLHHVPFVRDVAIDSVKTGIKGSANKGAVAIRMRFHSTSLCFVCGHLAAGQSNIDERNNNYHDISRRIAFPMGSSLLSHDYVFWCGDFNYRIDLPNEVTKDLVSVQDFHQLQCSDQLSLQKAEGKIFRSYIEGPINFPPTYKYDLFSDDYDTSEKFRTPAWTDRVLWRRKKYRKFDTENRSGSIDAVDDSDQENEEDGEEIEDEKQTDVWNPGQLCYYGRAELRTSDHRPVIAMLDIEVQHVDNKKLMKTHESVMQSFGPADPTIIVRSSNVSDDEMLDVNGLIDLFEPFGAIILVRIVEQDVLLTFDNGRSAFQALSCNEKMVGDCQIEVVLKSPETLSSTDLPLQMLVSADIENINNDDNNVTSQTRQRTMSDILSMSFPLDDNSLLIPEKINEQIDYSDDDEDDDGNDKQVFSDQDNVPLNDDNVNSIDSDEEGIIDNEETLIMQRKEELIDSDDEIVEDEKPKLVTKKAPPPRPTSRPGRPPPPKATSSPSNTPPLEKHRPPKPNLPQQKTVDDSKPKPLRPGRPQPMKSTTLSLDDGTTNESIVPQATSKTEGGETPLNKPPPRPIQATTLVDKAKTDESISIPFNVHHLFHVDATNVDQFIENMKKSGGTLKPQRPNILGTLSQSSSNTVTKPITREPVKPKAIPRSNTVSGGPVKPPRRPEPSKSRERPAAPPPRPISVFQEASKPVPPQRPINKRHTMPPQTSEALDKNVKEAPPRPAARLPTAVTVNEEDDELINLPQSKNTPPITKRSDRPSVPKPYAAHPKSRSTDQSNQEQAVDTISNSSLDIDGESISSTNTTSSTSLNIIDSTNEQSNDDSSRHATPDLNIPPPVPDRKDDDILRSKTPGETELGQCNDSISKHKQSLENNTEGDNPTLVPNGTKKAPPPPLPPRLDLM